MSLGIKGAWEALKEGDYEGAIAALFAGFDGIQAFVDDLIEYLRDVTGLNDK